MLGLEEIVVEIGAVILASVLDIKLEPAAGRRDAKENRGDLILPYRAVVVENRIGFRRQSGLEESLKRKS